MTVEVNGAELLVKPTAETKAANAAHGLYRALIQNMVTGVTAGFTKTLVITGVGYRAEVKGILTKYKASCLSDLESQPENFPAILKEAEAIGNE